MDLKDLIERGDQERKARAFPAAVATYEQALAMRPDHPRTLLALADAYRGAKQVQPSIAILQHYLDLRPRDGSARCRLADAYKRARQRDLAVEQYRKVLALEPSNRYALMGLGDLFYKENRHAQALACWEPLLQIDPDLLNIQTMVGNMHRKLLDFSRAEARFRAVLARESDNRPALFGLADSLRGLGRFLEAVPLWETMLELDPGNNQVLTRAGDCFTRLGLLERAEALFGQVIAQGYDKAALMGLARVHRRRKDFPAALALYQSILERNPADARTLRLVAETRQECVIAGGGGTTP